MNRPAGEYLHLKVSAITPETDSVTSFTFEDPDGRDLPAFSPGAHIMLLLTIDGRVHRNSYTLTGDPDDRLRYRISVQFQPDGRGGSRFLHQSLRLGDMLPIRVPMNFFSIDRMARRHLMIAGGIGITPFLGFAQDLSGDGTPFELHYAVRSLAEAPFGGLLKARYGERVRLYDRSAGDQLDIPALLARQMMGTHIYVCGPPRMMNAVERAVDTLGVPQSCYHHERFRAPSGGNLFSVMLHGKALPAIEVTSDQTMLEALENAGVDIPSMCRVGACGRCLLKVHRHSGRLLHNDHVLSAAEKATGDRILPCVSRCEGRIEVAI